MSDEDIERKILDGYYLADNAPDYPGNPKAFRGEGYRDWLKSVREIEKRLRVELDRDLLEYVGLTGHPKAQRALDMARERAASQYEIYTNLQELAELILD